MPLIDTSLDTDTHLVSASSTVYLMFSAYKRGLYFEPDAGIGMGLVLPFFGVLMSTMTTYGILEVGNTILDPFGDDAEDFALLHFVEYAMRASFEAIRVTPLGKRTAEREAFYSYEEIAAGTRIMKALIKRYRWLKLIEASVAKSGLNKRVSLSPEPEAAAAEQMKPGPPEPRQQPTIAYIKAGSSTNGVDSSVAQAMKIVDGDADGQMRPRVQKVRRKKRVTSNQSPGSTVTVADGESSSLPLAHAPVAKPQDTPSSFSSASMSC